MIQVCDGTRDCISGADECGPTCIDRVFADDKSMIKNKGILVFVAILGESSAGHFKCGIRRNYRN